MTIREFSPAPLRKRIGFVGKLPVEAQETFEKRGYTCYVFDEDTSKDADELKSTDSVVLTQTLDAPYHIRQELGQFAQILNHDCRLYIRYAPSGGHKEVVLRALNRLQLPPSGFVETTDARFFDRSWFEGPNAPILAPFAHILQSGNNWDFLANLIVNNPAGPAPRTDLEIIARDAEHGRLSLSDEDELLLKRAFWNCSSVSLMAKMNGLSGVAAFEAFAHLEGDDNRAGSTWPYRYFVKLGPRTKVAREYDKYRTTALENVPYHLGPRLRMDRCVLGRSKGLIVSDYVAGAETLRDCAREGRAVPAIGNLFNLTLLAWRRAANSDDRPLQESLVEKLPDEIPDHREQLMRSYGAKKTLAELKELFTTADPNKPVLTGVIHGDLHATNVLVRMGDAVIIDLERIGQGMPLLFDAASLEGGLFVDGFIGDRRSAKEVLESLEKLYTYEALGHDDPSCHPGDGSAWFVDSVRQIRMQARQMELKPRQYGWALAAVFLKKACNPEDFRTEDEINGTLPATRLTREAVRALAFVLAERILSQLSR